MIEQFLPPTQIAPCGAFRIAAPVAGEMMGNALRSMYQTYHDLPDDLQSLLDRLDSLE